MKAIRCKSSSQVSSQVMNLLQLLLISLVVVTARKKSDINDKVSKKGRNPYQILTRDVEKYELCVKLLRVCQQLRDKPPDYTDVEEESANDYAINEEDKAKYRKGNCLPKDLTADGEKEFWKTAAKWQREIDDSLLIQNLFVVIKTDGPNTKLAFGKWKGWCNRTDISEESTEPTDDPDEDKTLSVSTTTELSLIDRSTQLLKNCKQNSNHGKWIFNEIDGSQELNEVIRKVSHLILSLEKYKSKNCCPYESIRDRLEIINDGIDFLNKLQGIKSSIKPTYTDLNSDLNHLSRRLEHLNRETTNNDLSPLNSNFDYLPFFKKEKSLQKILISQLSVIRNLENSVENKNSKHKCCMEEKSKIIDLKRLFDDLRFINSFEKISQLIDPLKEDQAYTNETLSATKSLLSLEDKNIQKLTFICETECHQKDTSHELFQNLVLKVDKLAIRLNDMSGPLKSANLSHVKQSEDAVNKMIKDGSSVIANLKTTNLKLNNNEARTDSNEPFPITVDNSSLTKNCSEDSAKLSDLFDKINKDKNYAIDYYQQQQNNTMQQLKEIQERQKALDYYIHKAKVSEDEESRLQNPNSVQWEIKQLENDLEKLENGINKLDKDLQYSQLKFEMEKEQIDREVEEQLNDINLFREAMKREQDLIDQRLAELEELETPDDYDDKLSKLEAMALEFPKQIKSYEKELLNRIADMEQQLKDLDKEIENTEHRADTCDGECDFGDLNSVDELIGRVQIVKKILS
ncbi:nucleoporin GLE1 [Drosophila ficusphila]|uniref:nucleoporin GLE1 n=1 Tax=Drosophila ficusphila TaxID=30025 RepID=UPI0007E60454|nr:nucleoporin GLE1 [Drosophila ficusphila]